MTQFFDINKPIFIQIREIIEDQIVNNQLKEEEQVPSTNQLVNFYRINHATVTKGVNQLVEEEILYKKRGIGIFVSKGAREILIAQRKKVFVEEYVIPLVEEAEKLGITESEVVDLVKKTEGRQKNGI